jgi:hypothetical protein
VDDLASVADHIIAQIPPLPELRQRPGHTPGLTPWETPQDSMLHTSFTQFFQEPHWRFFERCECYWWRGCAMKLAQAMELPRNTERVLIRECWLKLKRPSQLPRWPEFLVRRSPTADTSR